MILADVALDFLSFQDLFGGINFDDIFSGMNFDFGGAAHAKPRHPVAVPISKRISTCPTCQGRGSVIEQPCAHCQGNGQASREEVLTLKIPRGIKEGMALRVPGKGLPSPDASGSAGDLLVVVHAQPGTVLRLKVKGLPEYGSEIQGDMYLHLAVHVPEKLSAEERKLCEKLRALNPSARR